jgi:hypothetical protein
VNKFNGNWLQTADWVKVAFQNEQFSDLAKLIADGVLFWHPVLTVRGVGKLDIVMSIKSSQENERFISLGKITQNG